MYGIVGVSHLQPTRGSDPGIIALLADTEYTTRDIAHKYLTTLDALMLWMAKEDIQTRIDVFRCSTVQRLRLQTANHLPIALQTVVRLLHEYHHDESHRIYKPGDPRRPDQERRAREAARKCVSLLLRLFHLDPNQSTHRARDHRDQTRATAPRPSHLQDHTLDSPAARAAPDLLEAPTFQHVLTQITDLLRPHLPEELAEELENTPSCRAPAVTPGSGAPEAQPHQPTPTVPTATTLPFPEGRGRGKGSSLAEDASPAQDASLAQSARPTAPATPAQTEAPAAAPQAEGLPASSRARSESSSDTPESESHAQLLASESPHREAVLVPRRAHTHPTKPGTTETSPLTRAHTSQSTLSTRHPIPDSRHPPPTNSS